MAKRAGEDNVYRAAKSGLKRWLSRAKDAVMAPFRNFGAQPNPSAIYSTVPAWQAEVDLIMAELSPALQAGWAAANLPGDYSPDDPYIRANLALTQNLLVRIPDEVYAKVIAAILEGTNAGEDKAAIAARVNDILTFTGSENWDHRAEVIAQTECNRHYNGSLLAHGLLQEKQDGGVYMKEWDTQMDGRERLAHHEANSQRQLLHQPYIVDNELLLFPGDPVGSPENVINCRCGQKLEKVS